MCEPEPEADPPLIFVGLLGVSYGLTLFLMLVDLSLEQAFIAAIVTVLDCALMLSALSVVVVTKIRDGRPWTRVDRAIVAAICVFCTLTVCGMLMLFVWGW